MSVNSHPSPPGRSKARVPRHPTGTERPAHAGPAGAEPPRVETGRLEALSDGVFAVAITLLALELKVPPVSGGDAGHRLGPALLEQWPIYLAYVLSFTVILITWVNHHNLFRLVRRADHGFLLLNGLLLMTITALPFATALLAEYLLQSDNRVAMEVYSGLSLAMALAFNRLWAYAAKDGRLLAADVDEVMVRNTTKSFSYGPPLYTAAFLLAFVSVPASLGLSILLAAFYALPRKSRRR